MTQIIKDRLAVLLFSLVAFAAGIIVHASALADGRTDLYRQVIELRHATDSLTRFAGTLVARHCP